MKASTESDTKLSGIAEQTYNNAVPPTHTDSRISRGIYGHTDTTRHYTEARFRHQAQDMLLVDLVAVSVRPTETFL